MPRLSHLLRRTPLVRGMATSVMASAEVATPSPDWLRDGLQIRLLSCEFRMPCECGGFATTPVRGWSCLSLRTPADLNILCLLFLETGEQ
ncbi:hypothetical protein GC176_23610 [bacterium]|nr:hypothetical protein [bacterium]